MLSKRRNLFHIRLERAALRHGMGYVPPAICRDLFVESCALRMSGGQRKVDECRGFHYSSNS